MAQIKDAQEDFVQEGSKANVAFNKQIQDVYVQMRKLSSDVFDQVKTLRGNVDLQAVLEREREQNKQLVLKLQQENEEKNQEMWNQIRDQLQEDISTLRTTQSGTNDVLNKMKG